MSLASRWSDFTSRLRRGRFARDVAVLAGGTVVAQGVVALASPVLTRLYSPADFGVMTVYASLLGMAVVVASLSYQMAIPLPEEDAIAADLLGVCAVCLVMTGGLASLGVWWMGRQVLAWTHSEALGPYLWLLPVGLVLSGAYDALRYWAIRKRAFGRIARTVLTQNISSTVVQIGTGVAGLRPVGLIVGLVIGGSAGSGTLALLAWKENRADLLRVSLAGMAEAARRYRRFPLISNFASLLNQGAVWLPPLLLASLYGTAIAGRFSLAVRVMGVPLALVGRAVGQVYVGEASRLAGGAGGLHGLFTRTVRRLAVLGLAVVAIGLGGPWLFGAIFGAQWQEAGWYLFLLTPAYFAQFVVAPVGMTANILERQDLQLASDGLRAAVIVGSVVGAHYAGWSATTAIALFAAGTAATYVGYYFVFRRLAQADSGRQGP